MKVIKTFCYYLAQHIKNILIYRLDFLFVALSDFLWSLIGVLMMLGIFNYVPNFNGYNFDEVMFIYGFSLLSLGIYYIFFSNISNLPDKYIYDGELDRVLVRPINSYAHILLDKFSLDKCGNLISGSIIISVMWNRLGLDVNFLNIMMLVLLVICSAVVYLSLFTIFSCVSFWVNDRFGITGPLVTMRLFAKYPIDIYNNVLKFTLTWVLPYGFTAFYPSLYFIEGHNINMAKLAPITIVVAIVWLMLATMIWKIGLKRYSSVGS